MKGQTVNIYRADENRKYNRALDGLCFDPEGNKLIITGGLDMYQRGVSKREINKTVGGVCGVCQEHFDCKPMQTSWRRDGTGIHATMEGEQISSGSCILRGGFIPDSQFRRRPGTKE